MSPDIEIERDLLFALANLTEIEHHARFSYLSTKNKKYLELLNWARELRAKRMKEIEREEDSQWHCAFKHLLSLAYRFFEVGDKYLSKGKTDFAISYYEDAYNTL